jgi:methylated-DNA-[protein]-cysteine S-methyltransferase
METPLLKKAAQELQEYFIGKRKRFDLPLSPQGTDFQQKVWKALQDIPYGAVCSYKDIARAIGNEKACRAVGGANNKNPISIIIPCHRVIGANGSLVGYGGGIEIKKQLLALEQK